MKKIMYLKHHPELYLARKWNKLRRKFSKPLSGKLVKDIAGVTFEYDFDLDQDMIHKMYFGLYEPEIIKLMKDFLKPDDTYIDIGSNVGYLAAIGAGLVGKKGVVHCFEPVKKYYERISSLAKNNPEYTIITNNFALGDCEDSVAINVSSHLGQSSFVDGFCDDIQMTENVSIKRFDDYAREYQNLDPALIKIDTEGYEYYVLKGMEGYLKENDGKLPPILVEMTPYMYPEINLDIREFEDYMKSFGYQAYCYIMKRFVDLNTIKDQRDILFIKQ